MEGYLYKKGAGESSFGRRNWKKRWFVLEGTDLTYFENIDLISGIPVSQKGSLSVKGCEIKEVLHHEKKHVFIIQNPQGRQMYICADEERMLHIWIKALQLSAKGESSFEIDYSSFYTRLGLDPDQHPDASTINRAYRKKALKVHPDKGGDIVEFKKLQEACDMLIGKIEEDEKSLLYDTITFEAVIQKGGKGVGFGMIVNENPKKGNIVIKEILPTMKLLSLGDAARGSLQLGDELIKIGIDDSSKWPLSRVVQRLNDFRVPVNSEIRLVFARLVEKVDRDAATPESSNPNADNPFPSPVYKQTYDSVDSSRHPSPEALYNESRARSSEIAMSPADFSSVDKFPGNLSRSGESKLQGQLQSNGISHDIGVTRPARPDGDGVSGNEGVASDALVESLQQQLQETSLMLMNAEQDKTSFQDALTRAIATNRELVAQLQNVCSALSVYVQREQNLSLQTKQLLTVAEVSREKQSVLDKKIMDITAVVQSGGEPSAFSEEVEVELSRHGLGTAAGDVDGHQNAALRCALLATAGADITEGMVLKKWASDGPGHSAVDKLLRLEERMKALPENDQEQLFQGLSKPSSPAPVANKSVFLQRSTSSTSSMQPLPRMSSHSLSSELGSMSIADSADASEQLTLNPNSVHSKNLFSAATPVRPTKRQPWTGVKYTQTSDIKVAQALTAGLIGTPSSPRGAAAAATATEKPWNAPIVTPGSIMKAAAQAAGGSTSVRKAPIPMAARGRI